MNQRKLISLLIRSESLSRADLAKAAGMSQPTAGKIISALVEDGILVEADAASTQGQGQSQLRLGRPGRLVSLEQQYPRFIGVELGVADSSVMGATLGATVAWAEQFSTPSNPGRWLTNVQAAISKHPSPRVVGMVVSVPGILNEEHSSVLYSPNLHWLEQMDLITSLQERCKLPVVLIQEIQALALGHVLGAPIEDLFLVDFGMGVGGAVIFEGKLHGAGAPLSGELGHTPVSGNNRQCGCGGVGCLETLVSQEGLLKSFREVTNKPSATWESLVKHVQTSGPEPWITRSLQSAGRVIAGALNVLGLRKVVATGLIADLPPWAADVLRKEVAQDALWSRFGEVIFETADRKRVRGMVAAGIDRLMFPQPEQINILT